MVLIPWHTRLRWNKTSPQFLDHSAESALQDRTQGMITAYHSATIGINFTIDYAVILLHHLRATYADRTSPRSKLRKKKKAKRIKI